MKFKNKLIFIPILILAAALVFTAARVVYAQQQGLSEKMIRLRVVANSDSDSDQALKLHVRDCVNTGLSEILINCDSKEAAFDIISRNLDLITSLSEDAVKKYGYEYPVSVSFTEEFFPTREYETFNLPAGKYTSLQINIGEAAGQNWWCVVFPPICGQLATQETLTEMDFTQEEIKLITSDDSGVILKFRLLECIGSIRQFIENI